MPSSVLAAFALVLACAGAATADNGFLLGLDYSKPVGFGMGPATIAADPTGALYILGSADASTSIPATSVLGPVNATQQNFYLMKVTAQGDTVYIAILGFESYALAVDSTGSAYVTGPSFVAKINQSGTAFVYKADLGQGLRLAAIAVDPSGRAYVAGNAYQATLQTTPNAFQPTPPDGLGGPMVVRLSADGSTIEFATYVGTGSSDSVGEIALGPDGSAFLLGSTGSPNFPTTPGAYQRSIGNGAEGFLTRLNASGSGLIYSTFTGFTPPGIVGPNPLAVDASGNATVGGTQYNIATNTSTAVVKAFNKDGTALRWMKEDPFAGGPYFFLSVDAAGNTYVVTTNAANSPVQNSIASCGKAFLNVYSLDGQLLQATYLPDLTPQWPVAIATGRGGTVYAVSKWSVSTSWRLLHLSQNPRAVPVKLACVTNAGSYDSGDIAAGEIVSLFGQGLGPTQGVVPKVNLNSGFPNQLSNVQVTFDGKPAPLLYVQDSQINAIAPWSLAEGVTTQICVIYRGASTNCLTRSVAKAAPGVFTVDGIYAAALNQDGTLNSSSNPAKYGSIVSVFATGLGPINPALPDGSIVMNPLPVNTLPLQVGWVQLTLQGPSITHFDDAQYAGPIAFEVAGVSQINFQVQNALSFLSVGGVYSSSFWLWVASP